MKTLTYPKDKFDNSATFKVAGVPGRCYLFCVAREPEYSTFGGDAEYNRMHVMQRAGVLQGSYSAQDIAERERFNALEPVRDGDSVEVDGLKYVLHVNGNYSDCGYLIPA